MESLVLLIAELYATSMSTKCSSQLFLETGIRAYHLIDFLVRDFSLSVSMQTVGSRRRFFSFQKGEQRLQNLFINIVSLSLMILSGSPLCR